MTGTKVPVLIFRISAAVALVLAALFCVALWMLRPEPLPDLLQGLSVHRNPAEWDRVSLAMTEQLLRKMPTGSLEEDVVETFQAQGFKAVGLGEDRALRFMFERQDFPCVERFIVRLRFDDARRLHDVLGHYGPVCL
jgi:hypothetical protein